MSKKVLWSPIAESDLRFTLFYLESNWNNAVVNQYLNKIDYLVNQITTNPEQFPLVNNKKKIRKCVVTKHNTIFYREKDEVIEILRIFDTRQNPKKLIYG